MTEYACISSLFTAREAYCIYAYADTAEQAVALAREAKAAAKERLHEGE